MNPFTRSNRAQRRTIVKRLRRRQAAWRFHAAVLYAIAQTRVAQEIITDDGETIPIGDAVPGEGPHIHIPRIGDNYTWTDVHNFVTGTWHSVTSLWSSATSFPKQLVADMIDAAISAAQTAWASFVNLAVDFTTTATNALNASLDTLQGYVLGYLSFLQTQIDGLLHVTAGLVWDVVPGILDDIAGLEQRIIRGIDEAVNEAERWAVANVYDPLVGTIWGVLGEVRGEIGAAIDGLRDELSRLIHNEGLQRIAGIAALAATVARVLDWVKDCGDPICRDFGVGSKLGDALRKLAPLLAALAALELSHLTEHDLERYARLIATGAAGGAESLFEGFVQGGETVGDAGGAIFGAAGGIADEILRDLGVPI